MTTTPTAEEMTSFADRMEILIKEQEAERDEHRAIADALDPKISANIETVANLRLQSAENPNGVDLGTEEWPFSTWEECYIPECRITLPALATPQELRGIMQANPIRKKNTTRETQARKKNWCIEALSLMGSRTEDGWFNLKALLKMMWAVGMTDNPPESSRTTVSKHLADSDQFEKSATRPGWWRYTGELTSGTVIESPGP